MFPLILFLLLSPAFPATISGSAHDWETLELLRPVTFTINTTPVQTIASTDGSYSFQVPAGTYSIRAAFIRAGKTELQDSLELRVDDPSGSYWIDLILLPPSDIEGSELAIPDSSAPEFSLPAGQPSLLVLAILAAGFGLAFLLYLWKRRPAEPVKRRAVTPAPAKSFSNPELSGIVKILSAAGGRINQRELRRQLPYSEAKASLLLSELEARGIVRKYKRGRGNLLVLSQKKSRA